ncbi:hypothetical protein BCR33DRAFT_441297 [Rhizoclosmatium globosum]|uniref:Uncharacterized protein n=1 Tax=Rhizoclosmatium globosum TaxID=329046 RepID=A0A1Y2BTG0_9FUNG|nr:hypothetical protein BCR33DRAFT_441297 [Rhizoclosmatium globosum]|eukprot:ORY37927.1 hypothetical protein BCR33DRAFT_441297 [Rhizoclosmatium globosum]
MSTSLRFCFFARHLVFSWPQFQPPDLLLCADLSIFWSTSSTLNLADLCLGPLWVHLSFTPSQSHQIHSLSRPHSLVCPHNKRREKRLL